MTQPQNSQPFQPTSGTNQTSLQQSPQRQTKLGRCTEKFLIGVLEPVDVLGQHLIGELWPTFYLTIQDALVLALLLQVPGWLGQWIIGKNFSSFDVCLQENALGVSRYACFIIVASDFLLWIVLAGRAVIRFWQDLKGLKNSNRGTGHGSGQP